MYTHTHTVRVYEYSSVTDGLVNESSKKSIYLYV